MLLGEMLAKSGAASMADRSSLELGIQKLKEAVRMAQKAGLKLLEAAAKRRLLDAKVFLGAFLIKIINKNN
jgi:translation initiation factor IF-3